MEESQQKFIEILEQINAHELQGQIFLTLAVEYIQMNLAEKGNAEIMLHLKADWLGEELDAAIEIITEKLISKAASEN